MEVNDVALGEQKVNWDSGDSNVTKEQILGAIAEQENPNPQAPQTEQPAVQTPVVTESTGQVIPPIQDSGQVEKTATSTTPAAAPTTGEPPKVENQPALTDEKLQEFIEKKHIAPQDTYKVVEMYKNLEREFSKKSQELASLKRIAPTEQAYQQPVQPVSPITGLPYTNNDTNAQLLEDLQQNPIVTMRKIAELAYGSQVSQLSETINEQRLHNTVVKLSTSPDTAEFNLPVVQEEIKAIISERPEMGQNLSENLATLNDLAIGRLYRTGKLNKDAVEAGKKIAEQNIANRASVGMDVGAKPVVQQSKTPEQMTTEEYGAYLREGIITGRLS